MKDSKNLSRRAFLKRAGAATATALFYSLSPINILADDDDKKNRKDEPVHSDMTYRINRHTHDKVSILGYGMMRLPYKNRQIDQEMVNQEVAYAIEHGVNYFDTSPHYCNSQSEASLGQALKGFPRDKFMVATKLSNFGQEEWSAEASKKMYYNSFKNLGVDVIDYYLLHGIGMGGMKSLNGRFIDNGMLDFLLEERKAGRIRNLGFSYHGEVEVFDYLLSINDKCHWDFVQIEMNYVDWEHAHDLNKRNTDAIYLNGELEKRGIQAVIMEPLLGGRLARLPENLVKKLKAKRPDDSVASWAFRWVGTQPNTLTALSGMTTMEVLKENVKTFSPLDPVTKDEEEMLMEVAAIYAGYHTIPCTACKYCMPCPYGVDIPGNFAFYNQGVTDGTLPPLDRSAEDYKEKTAAFIDAYKKAIPADAWATKCLDCGECLSKCPQHIRIPNQMERLMDMLEA